MKTNLKYIATFAVAILLSIGAEGKDYKVFGPQGGHFFGRHLIHQE